MTKKNYYIGSSAITLTMYLAIINGTGSVQTALIEGFLSLAIMVLGINFVYATKRGDDFITRVVLLSFPLFIKTYTAAALVGCIMGFYAALAHMHPISDFLQQ